MNQAGRGMKVKAGREGPVHGPVKGLGGVKNRRINYCTWPLVGLIGGGMMYRVAGVPEIYGILQRRYMEVVALVAAPLPLVATCFNSTASRLPCVASPAPFLGTGPEAERFPETRLSRLIASYSRYLGLANSEGLVT